MVCAMPQVFVPWGAGHVGSSRKSLYKETESVTELEPVLGGKGRFARHSSRSLVWGT